MIMNKFIIISTAICILPTLGGCVHRRFHIRSSPEGAPVWVDEQYAGTTPLELGFTHYGARRVRIGPVRDEEGAVKYRSSETVFRLNVPWYQRFPLDFFSEVLWPGTIEDIHTLSVDLDPAEELRNADDEQRALDALREAREFKSESDRPPEDF